MDPDLLQRDVETLKESIRRGFDDLTSAATAEERAAIRKHLKWCSDELRKLLDHIDHGLDKAGS